MFTQLTFMAGTDEKKLKFLDVAKLRIFFPFHLASCERDVIFRVSDNKWYKISDNDWDELCVSLAAFHMVSTPALHFIGADCPVICAQYAKRNGLLGAPGWKHFRTIAKIGKKMIRMINQAKLSSFHRAPYTSLGTRSHALCKKPSTLIKKRTTLAGKMQWHSRWNSFKSMRLLPILGKAPRLQVGIRRFGYTLSSW